MESGSADQATLEVFQDTAGADAFMQFHVSGDYAAYFGLKGDINDFAVGGWSMGATYYRLWHAGNDGSGSGLDADLLDGIQASSFLRSDTSDTFTGSQLFFGSSSNWLANGEIFVGNTEITSSSIYINGNLSWHAGNDGSGSGLDADTLDGINSGSFLRSDANDSTSGALTIKNTVYTDYNSTNTDITGLVGGSAFGSLIQPTESAHLVVGLRDNDASDSFSVVSGSGNWNTDNIYDKLVFAAKANGDLYAGSNKIWHAGNDGAGSGLDADLLDGQDASYYRTSLSDDTSNNITMYPLFYEATSGTTAQLYTSSTKLQYNPSTGTLSATNLNSLSDATKKTNIETIDNALDITTKLRGVRYDWIDNKKSSIGLIAQEVEEILPEIVETSSDNMKTIAYGNLVGLLIESVKDLKSEINTLKQEIEQLKK